jgi:hypothetical protein
MGEASMSGKKIRCWEVNFKYIPGHWTIFPWIETSPEYTSFTWVFLEIITTEFTESELAEIDRLAELDEDDFI